MIFGEYDLRGLDVPDQDANTNGNGPAEDEERCIRCFPPDAPPLSEDERAKCAHCNPPAEEPTKPRIVVVGRSAAQIREEEPEDTDWLIPGKLARGWSTNQNGREKLGKGWFETYLLGRLERGQATVFGPEYFEPVKALIYTEEPNGSIRKKLAIHNLNDAWVLYHRDLKKMNTWAEKVEYLAALTVELGRGVLFVDNISNAAGVADENGKDLAIAAEPLAEAAKENNIATLFDHQHRKSGGPVEDRGRGGTALQGVVDVIMAMERGAGRRRKITTWGRVPENNSVTTIELTADYADYVVISQSASFHDGVITAPGVGHKWTVDTAAAALGISKDTARRYLNNDAAEGGLVEKIDEKGGENGRAAQWQVIALAADESGESVPPSLD